MTRTGSLGARKITQDMAENPRPDDDVDVRITHYIPSLELTGSRTEKLKTLDTLIGYLQELRRSLAGEVPGAPPYESRSPYALSPAWPWFAAGVVLGALFVLMLLIARSWS